MRDRLIIRNLYKIFGPDPEKAIRLLDEGLSKEENFDRTGNALAIRDASFTAREGEVLVVMGLSGSGKSTLGRMLNRLIDPTSAPRYRTS
jgi:glycine betaine/proline transport system ATP-binding protein